MRLLNLSLILLVVILLVGVSSQVSVNESQYAVDSYLLDTSPFGCRVDFDPLVSLEDLIRNQSILITEFEDLLSRTPTNAEERIMFFYSFEDLVRRQAQLISTFEDFLKKIWYKLSADQQQAFLCSFEDLLNREIMLIDAFGNHINQSWGEISPDNKTKLLASFEDLIRRQSELERSYEDLYKMTHGGISIYKWADKIEVFRGENVTYYYMVRSWYNQTVTNITIVDSNLGVIASGITLRPSETKTFSKTIRIYESTCNIATVYWTGHTGKPMSDESLRVCVQVRHPNFNYDTIKIGNQSAYAGGGDPPEATNIVDITKTQSSSKTPGIVLTNTENIKLGDQLSRALFSGYAENNIKIISEQR